MMHMNILWKELKICFQYKNINKFSVINIKLPLNLEILDCFKLDT